jgi:hypothetical protein
MSNGIDPIGDNKKQLDGIYVNISEGVDGISWPVGTPGMPSNNLMDAFVIANARKTNLINVVEDWNEYDMVDMEDLTRSWVFKGHDAGNNGIDLNGKDVYNSTFLDLALIGEAASFLYCRRCNLAVIVEGISAADCEIFNLTQTLIGTFDLFNPKFTSASLYFTGVIATARIYNAKGDLTIIDVDTGGAVVNIYGDGLKLTISAHCTNGTINVYGDVKIINNSAGTTVNDYTNKPKPEVAVNTTATNAAETDILNLAAVNYHYTVDKLRLKSDDPGANTVTVRLYELVNGASVEVDSFAITTVNYGTYFSLMDMFGEHHLAGDNLKVTVRASAGGPYAITGSYAYRSA